MKFDSVLHELLGMQEKERKKEEFERNNPLQPKLGQVVVVASMQRKGKVSTYDTFLQRYILKSVTSFSGTLRSSALPAGDPLPSSSIVSSFLSCKHQEGAQNKMYTSSNLLLQRQRFALQVVGVKGDDVKVQMGLLTMSVKSRDLRRQ